MRTPSQKGRHSRTKGHAFERYIAGRLRHIFPNARRRLEYHSDVAADGVDLDETGDINFQIKKLKKYVSINTIKEIKRTSGINVLVTQADREPAMAVLKLDDFIKLIELIYIKKELGGE
jgi:hypothetical protein